MRYDKRIHFIRKGQEEYDPIKGEWVGGANSSHTLKWRT